MTAALLPSGPPHASEPRSLQSMECIALAHLALFIIGASWAFGGNADAVRPLLACWGTLGALITLKAATDPFARAQGWLRPLRWLWPLAAFNVLVLAGALNPSFRELAAGPTTVLVRAGGIAGLPTSAQPSASIFALWLFDGIWISTFNLALIVRSRRALRGFLLVIAANALALAVFGTVQKLSHAPGLFFGAVPSPQTYFFASFIYHNHWGAFTVLMIAVCLALAWRYARRHQARDWLHSPLPAGLVAIFFLAASVPLSTSRSCTLLAFALLAGAFLHWITRRLRQRHQFNESAALPLSAAVLAVLLASAGVWFLARETIETRVAKTREQFTEMRARGHVGDRLDLYRSTWRMALDKPAFGWGMASYPQVFILYNKQESPLDHLPVFYHDAHCDWLQALAEHGFVGTTLLALCALVPLRHLRSRNPLTAYLLAGCALLLLYAWIEFPFGNVAVVLAWWTCFFTAIHYARLPADEPPSPSSRSFA